MHVRTVLLGQVEWQNEQLRVRVELVDAQDGSRLWGETYQPARAEILTTQAAIVREIAAKLHRQLSPENQQQLARRQTTNNRAFDLYAQGRQLYAQDAYKNREQVLTLFGQALALDPGYALAYCGIADEYAELASQFLPSTEVIPKARDAALKALELDESLPDAHLSLARIKLWGDWDWVSAEREYKRALELNPKLAQGRLYYGEMLAQQRRFDEALREIKRVEEYDPVSMAALGAESNVYYAQHQFDRALDLTRNLLELHPNKRGGQEKIAMLFSLKGQHQEALTQLRAVEPYPEMYWRAAYLYGRAGQREEALKWVQRTKEHALQGRVSPVNFARVYVGLGEPDEAFLWLRKAYDEHNDHLLHIYADPIFDPLRTDPRFAQLLRNIGLAP